MPIRDMKCEKCSLIFEDLDLRNEDNYTAKCKNPECDGIAKITISRDGVSSFRLVGMDWPSRDMKGMDMDHLVKTKGRDC